MSYYITLISILLFLSGCATLGLESKERAEQLELKALAIPPELKEPVKAEDTE